MAAASQAVPGEFDSRHLLQVSIIRTICLQQANGSDYLFILKKNDKEKATEYFRRFSDLPIILHIRGF